MFQTKARERNQPRAPAERRRGEFVGEAGGHLGLELALELVGVGHEGLGVLLLLLHVHVHVPHRHLVVQLRHPAVRVLPRRAVEGEGLRLPRRPRRLRGVRRRRRRPRGPVAGGVEGGHGGLGGAAEEEAEVAHGGGTGVFGEGFWAGANQLLSLWKSERV